jgi:periplasmic divalent cation tolerance protein
MRPGTKTLESAPAVSAEKVGDAPTRGAADGLVVVLCTAPADKAEAIARALLEPRLAACVNVVPGVVSLYWWKGAIEREGEALLLIKTRRSLLEELTRAVQAVHPHAVPEVIALPIESGAGNPEYHAWLHAETEARPEEAK